MYATQDGDPTPPATFARLLRRYRLENGLTQEALAERARLSREAVSALERGERQYPRPDTVELLAEALELPDEERDALLAAATRPLRPRTDPPPTTMPAGEVVPAAPMIHAPQLPVPPTSLLGRAEELANVRALLIEEGTRLLTLSGPGGVGKTRLALAVATTCRDAFADGVVFVPLASHTAPALLADTIAHAAGAHEQGDRRPEEALVAHLRDRRLLLVLDNFEHLLPAAPLLAELLAACPCLTLLVTSRSILRLRGEQVLPVPPLPLPDATSSPAVEALATAAAVALFLDRARAVWPEFALTPENAADVGAICRRLDGLPLAIELAAARIRLLPPRALLARLERRLPTLTGGPRDLPERQRTLCAALAWSYDLLSRAEQALLRRLSVFAGGATLEAVETVCRLDSAQEADALEWLAALVDHSLLRQEEPESGEPRLVMLETVRDYGLEQLAASGEREATEEAHARYYLALAEAAEPALRGPEQARWLERLDAEHDNLRAALGWAHDQREVDLELRLAGALWRFWWTRGYLNEGRRWLEAALTGGEQGSRAARARALNGAGNLAELQGDYGRAAALHEEALALGRALGDKQSIARSLGNLGNLAQRQGNYERAAALYEEALALYRELGETASIAIALNNLGSVAFVQDDCGRAATLFEESLALYRMLGDKIGSAALLMGLGLVASRQANYGRAAALLEEGLTLQRKLGDRSGSVLASLTGLGEVVYLQGDYGRAVALLEEGLALGRELGDKQGVGHALTHLGEVAYLRGDYGRAVALVEEGLVLHRRLEAKDGIAISLNTLGAAVGKQGDHRRAVHLHEESLTLFRKLRNKWGIASSLRLLGDIAREQADYGRAEALLEESLRLSREIGHRKLVAECLEGLIWMALHAGQPGRAAQLGGTAEALREALRTSLPPSGRVDLDRAVQAIRTALGEEGFIAAWAAGRVLPLDQAIEVALTPAR
jgi:predicted ATPase/transcriptional regulator with XRE-family HTH domain/uncharacterized protein HemY